MIEWVNFMIQKPLFKKKSYSWMTFLCVLTMITAFSFKISISKLLSWEKKFTCVATETLVNLKNFVATFSTSFPGSPPSFPQNKQML